MVKSNTSNSNKNNAAGNSKNTTSNSSKNNSGGTMKDTNKQFPDNRPARSGPGGE